MDPCHYLRILITNLSFRSSTPLPLPSSSFFCKFKLLHFPPQFSPIPTLPDPGPGPGRISACFTLTPPDFLTLLRKPPPLLKIDVYYRPTRTPFCGLRPKYKFLGRVVLPLELGPGPGPQVVEGKVNTVIQNGWVLVKKIKGSNQELYLNVKAQSDPRFVFEFDGEPECSPQVFQVQGSVKQPVFSVKFSFRNSGDGNLRSSSSTSEPSTSKSWLTSLKPDKDHNHHDHHPYPLVKERKGWSITIHDLSGSPVAAASMVTPFVPSQGSDRVSRSNPGAWLILRPGDGTWKPWGRLEAWRDRADGLGYKFDLLPDAGSTSVVMGPAGITLAQSTVPARAGGGRFSIDNINAAGGSPGGSPNSSFDFASWSGSGSSGSEVGSGSGWWPGFMYKGFVMSSTVRGERKRNNNNKGVVEIGVQHVTCTEDAAVFVALAAAMDLSMDACRPFSHKLRKELNGEFVV